MINQNTFTDIYKQNTMRLLSSKKNKIINLIFFILRKTFGGDRFSNLISYIETEVFKIKCKLNKKLYLLDYGCGKMDFSIFLIKKKLVNKSVCVDNYKLNNKQLINKNCKYINIKKDKNTFKKSKYDIALIIDVLHHIGIDKCHNDLKKICSISKFIIIKDHFEYGYLSRQMLRLADWFGNYGTNINIPKKYFTQIKWEKLLKKLKVNQVKIIKNVKQHKGLFSLILTPKHQFISIIENKF